MGQKVLEWLSHQMNNVLCHQRCAGGMSSHSSRAARTEVLLLWQCCQPLNTAVWWELGCTARYLTGALLCPGWDLCVCVRWWCVPLAQDAQVSLQTLSVQSPVSRHTCKKAIISQIILADVFLIKLFVQKPNFKNWKSSYHLHSYNMVNLQCNFFAIVCKIFLYIACTVVV